MGWFWTASTAMLDDALGIRSAPGSRLVDGKFLFGGLQQVESHHMSPTHKEDQHIGAFIPCILWRLCVDQRGEFADQVAVDPLDGLSIPEGPGLPLSDARLKIHGLIPFDGQPQ